MSDRENREDLSSDAGASELPTENLNTGDKALLRAAVTGEGLISITPTMIKDIGASLQERTKDIEDRFPGLVAACDYETRLAVTAWVFEAIVKHATDGGSFRYLIYDRLGFEHDAYVPLYLAGGMVISNEFDLSDGPKDQDEVSTV